MPKSNIIKETLGGSHSRAVGYIAFGLWKGQYIIAGAHGWENP
jgi:hypothetical protein